LAEPVNVVNEAIHKWLVEHTSLLHVFVEDIKDCVDRAHLLARHVWIAENSCKQRIIWGKGKTGAMPSRGAFVVFKQPDDEFGRDKRFDLLVCAGKREQCQLGVVFVKDPMTDLWAKLKR
jgi:hypothetical protein